jgi:cytochrome P450
MEHAFTEKSLRSSQMYLIQNVKTFQDVILQSSKDGKDWSQPFNMSQWSTYLNYDIMGDLVFGRRFDLMTSDSHRFVAKLIMNSTAFISTVSLIAIKTTWPSTHTDCQQFASLPLKAISRRVLSSGVLSLPIIGGDMATDDKRFFQYAEGILGERIAAEGKGAEARNDIMHHLLQATDPVTGKGFSREQLNVESSLLIAAGADTTSVTLAAAFFYLLHNPSVMDKLVDEVRSAYTAEEMDQITPAKLVGLPYLRAVIDESLRLSPPVPSLLPREVLKGGIAIDGQYIPKGTIVGVSAYAIHRNPEYFPEADSFYPERWIVSESDTEKSSSPNIPRTRQAVSIARQAFSSFSQGARGCIGRQLAYYELHTALALTLHRFDVRLAQIEDSTDWREGFPDVIDPVKGKDSEKQGWRREEEFQLYDRFLSDRNGPMVEFRERV